MGNYKSHCPNKEQKKSLNTIHDHMLNVDTRIIELESHRCKALFDSGASSNFVGRNIVKRQKVRSDKQYFVGKSFRLADQRDIYTGHGIELRVRFEGEEYVEKFYIINENPDSLILGYHYVKKSETNKEKAQPLMHINTSEKWESPSKFPTKCRIRTTNDSVVSWSRPIRSLKEKNVFAETIKEYERKGIVESSSSMWCHPVVLTRKKMVHYDFVSITGVLMT